MARSQRARRALGLDGIALERGDRQARAVSSAARKPSAAPTSRARRPRPAPSRARMSEWLE